jgi:ABC-type cobalamin/Fe3+-siderophores transport system ATPase subunit
MNWNESKIKKVFEKISEHSWIIDPLDNGEGTIRVLEFIWDLQSLESRDLRFKNAREDSFQHLVNNYDWDLEYTFFERFSVNNNETFSKFLEALIQPNHYSKRLDLQNAILDLREILNPEGKDIEVKYIDEEDREVYEIVDYQLTDENYPIGVFRNNIPFISVNFDKAIDQLPIPDKYLKIDFTPYNWWNDYSLCSRANLSYFDGNNQQEIGEIKLISSTDENYVDYEGNQATYLPLRFFNLNEAFCSLGQSEAFYTNLKSTFGLRFRSILYAIRDSAFFPDIADEFESNYYFKNSLIRYDEQERLIREVRYKIDGGNREDLYQFDFAFNPIYSEESVKLHFNFDDADLIPNRVFGIIGKNGVGKTQLIYELSKKLYEEDNSCFSPNLPRFSKIITVSYSPFDSFIPHGGKKNTDHIFCSLRNADGDLDNEKSRAIKFGITRRRIEQLNRNRQWKNALSTFIEGERLNSIFDENDDVNKDELNEFRRKLSSGQKILLESVSNIVAHIRYDSLILFDEPETHLHPNAIAELMNLVYNLVETFESFCIITTHSPIIIREILSKNVFILERFENQPEFRKINLESYGANLDELTEEVFGVKNIMKHHEIIIQRLISEGQNAEEIFSAIETEGIPTPLRLRLKILNQLDRKND